MPHRVSQFKRNGIYTKMFFKKEKKKEPKENGDRETWMKGILSWVCSCFLKILHILNLMGLSEFRSQDFKGTPLLF